MRLLAWDTETFEIRAGLLDPPMVVSSFAGGDRTWLETPPAALDTLAAALADPDVLIIVHNGVYDLAVAVAMRPELIGAVFAAYDAGRVRDTQIRQSLADIARGCLGYPREDGTKGYSLADLELCHLGRDRRAEKKDRDGWRLRYGELAGVPLDAWPAEAVQYAKDDAAGTLAVYKAQSLAYGDVQPGELDNTRQAFALHLMSVYGIRTDGVAVAALKAKLLVIRAENRERLRAAGFLKPVRMSADKLRAGEAPEWYEVAKRLGAPPRPMTWSRDMAAIGARVSAAFDGSPPMTETGRVATDADTLTRSGDPDLAILADAGGTEKLLTTYVPLMERGAVAKITPRYNVLVKSGRTSSSKPNLQNIPGEDAVRPCFIPSAPDRVFVSVDVSAMELRFLAYITRSMFGYSKMWDAQLAGRELHTEFAAALLEIPYDEGLALHTAGDPQFHYARRYAKIFNLGKFGGLGAATMVEYARGYDVEMTLGQAETYGEQWLETFPEMRDYFARISDLVGDGDAVVEAFGNKMLCGGASYTSAANFYVQNLAAQAFKEWCYRVTKECRLSPSHAPLYGCHPVAPIHDEIILEAPEGRPAHYAALRLAEIGSATMAEYAPGMPFPTSVAVMRRWDKDAKARYDADGYLVPWGNDSGA